MKRAVFLDRDGVLNRAIVRNGKPYPPAELGDVDILPGVREAVAKLRDAGFVLVIVTNQPDVSRGLVSRESVVAINAHLGEELGLDDFRTCFHDDDEDCCCRKPRPGAILAAAFDHEVDLTSSFMVGDRWRDIEAGYRAGCRTIFVDYGYSERQPSSFDYRVSSLHEASEIILGEMDAYERG